MTAIFWNILSLVLILISFGLLIPGIFLPVLTIEGSMSLPMIGSINLGSETRSILGTVEYLWETENYLVSVS